MVTFLQRVKLPHDIPDTALVVAWGRYGRGVTEVQRALAKRLGTRIESETGSEDAEAPPRWEPGFNFSDRRAGQTWGISMPTRTLWSHDLP